MKKWRYPMKTPSSPGAPDSVCRALARLKHDLPKHQQFPRLRCERIAKTGQEFIVLERWSNAGFELPGVADPQNGGTVTRPKYEYRYDARGNLIGIRDPLFTQNAARQTVFTFDERGNPLTRTLPDGLTESSVYDDFGRMIRMTSFEGVVTQYFYDDGPIGGGRLLQKKFYATVAAFNAGTIKETQSFVYDAFGREVSTAWASFGEPLGVSPRSDVWTNQYDNQSRLISVNSPTGSVFYEYDVFGRQTRVSSRGIGFQPVNSADYENDIRYGYDSLSRLATVATYERNNVAVDVDPVAAGNQPQTAAYAYSLNGSLDYQTNPDGTVTDFTYDDLNRLTDLDEYKKDTNTPTIFTDNPKLSEYSYTLRPDGKRDFADEVIRKDDGTVFSHTTFDWNYDAAGRLIDEVFTDVGNLMAGTDDYRATYTHDLTGNRLKKTVTSFNAEPQATAYTFDANDRMLTESLDTANNATIDQTTTYGYTGTQQSAKSVVSQISNSQISNQSFSYDLQGRMSNVVSTTYTSGTASRVDTIGYRYGTDGIRISARQDVTENSVTTTEITNYLIDANNQTGYQQVLEETVTDGTGNLLKKIVYTIGHDHISQTTFITGGPAQCNTAVFHMDGHGSTRVLTDLAGALFTAASLAQVFHYDAYGNALNFNMSQAATQYLYSGEQFDARIQQQYLRARYYNQANGTFNRLDPFSGNASDPQSLHKYRYTQGDPVEFSDPTGQFEGLAGLLAGLAIGIGRSGQELGQGAIITGLLEIGGKPAFEMRQSGMLLVSMGEFDLGFGLYNAGTDRKSVV